MSIDKLNQLEDIVKMEPGVMFVAPRAEATTTLEIAERSFAEAWEAFQVAYVELQGTRERLEMVRAHERWKAAQKVQAE